MSNATIANIRPRRSALYLPASNPRAVEKARGLDADVVILDLEDAVLPEAKPRRPSRRGRRAGRGRFRRAGRWSCGSTGSTTPWGAADLAAAGGGRTGRRAGSQDALAPADVRAYDGRPGRRAGADAPVGDDRNRPGDLRAGQDRGAAKVTRLSAFVMGINDLAKEMGARMTADRAPFHACLSLRRDRGQRPGSGHPRQRAQRNRRPRWRWRRCAARAREFGFDGKSLIHPSHLEICNRVFTPDAADVAWARAVIAAFDAPENAGKGALRVEGRLAERLHATRQSRNWSPSPRPSRRARLIAVRRLPGGTWRWRRSRRSAVLGRAIVTSRPSVRPRPPPPRRAGRVDGLGARRRAGPDPVRLRRSAIRRAAMGALRRLATRRTAEWGLSRIAAEPTAGWTASAEGPARGRLGQSGAAPGAATC